MTLLNKTLVFTIIFSLINISTKVSNAAENEPDIKLNPENYELSLNFFRNPSVGVELRKDWLSAHVGYYPTIVSQNLKGENENTSFIRAGVSLWSPSISVLAERNTSFYLSLSYVYGFDRNYAGKSGAITETGVKIFLWEGLNIRLGVAALFAPGQPIKINPTPGISYSFKF